MIYGKHIRLRAPERSDIPLFVSWLNDADVIENLPRYLPMSTGEEEQWFERMLQAPADEHPMVIEIKDGENWRPIGNVAFHEINQRSRNAEVGIFIGEKSEWNKGYGTEAMRLMLEIGFNTLNLHRIFLRTLATNLRGIRAYEKAGYIHEGCMRQAEYKNGQYIDMLFMSVLRPEWLEKQKAEK